MTAMSDDQALLAAVLAAPDDDAPRLHYADWLDVHGEEVQAARIRALCSKWWRTNLFHVSRDKSHSMILMPDGSQVSFKLECPPWCERVDWGRGFIESLACTAADWIAHADAILAAHPVQEVRLTTWPGWRCVAERADKGYCGYELRGGGEVVFADWLWDGPGDEPPADVSDRITLDLLRAEWPSVKTWRLPKFPVTQNGRQVGHLENVRSEEGRVVVDIVTPGSPGAGRITARIV